MITPSIVEIPKNCVGIEPLKRVNFKSKMKKNALALGMTVVRCSGFQPLFIEKSETVYVRWMKINLIAPFILFSNKWGGVVQEKKTGAMDDSSDGAASPQSAKMLTTTQRDQLETEKKVAEIYDILNGVSSRTKSLMWFHSTPFPL